MRATATSGAGNRPTSSTPAAPSAATCSAASSSVPIGPISVHQSAGIVASRAGPVARPAGAQLVEERQRPQSRAGVVEQTRQPGRHLPVRRGAVGGDAQGREHRDPEPGRTPGLVERPPDVRRAGRLGQHDAPGHPARHGQRPGAAHPGQQRRRLGRRLVELHIVQVHVAPVHRHPLARQQAPHGEEHLLQRGHRRGGPGTHLPHPRLHAVPDARQQPPRGERRQRGQLHRRDRRVAGHGGQDAEPDLHPLRHGQRGRAQAHPGGVEAVLDHPQRPGAAGLQPGRQLEDERRRERAVEAHPDHGSGRRGHGVDPTR